MVLVRENYWLKIISEIIGKFKKEHIHDKSI